MAYALLLDNSEGEKTELEHLALPVRYLFITFNVLFFTDI